MNNLQLRSLLGKVLSAQMQICARVGHSLGVGSSGSQALFHLAAEGSMAPSELGRRLSLTSAAVTALVDRLCEKGFVEREPNPSDRRGVRIILTPVGRKSWEAQVKPVSRFLEKLIGDLTPSQRPCVEEFLGQWGAVADLLNAKTITLDEREPSPDSR